MKRLLILTLILIPLCSLCAPVLAWSNTLNNEDLQLYVYPSISSYPYTYAPYSDTKLIRATSVTTGAIVFPNGSSTATYFAYDQCRPSTGSSPSYYYIGNGAGPIAFGYSGRAANDQGIAERIEMVRSSSSTLDYYVDGVIFNHFSTATTPATAFGAGISSVIDIDDPTFGNAMSDTAIVSVQPHNWYILKNYLNTNNYGQYDDSGNLVSTTNFHVKWSIGAQADGWTIASPPNDRYIIKVQAPSGAIAYNQYVNITQAGHAVGYVTIPFNKTYIGDQPFEYGIYFVTLYDGTSVRSTDYFRVLAANAGSTVTWDRNTYTASDTATVTYLVDPAYYDATLYTYTLSIKNIYGVEVASYPLSTSAGTVSVPLSGYSQGVHYGQLVITEIAAPTNIGILASSPMEISAYDTFNGYVMNAETGATLNGATVNISQSLLADSVTTNANGFYISTENWLVGSATTIDTTLSGYTSDSLTFTPIVAKNISVNISLMPSTPTTTGISIGGIVRDKTYHNPVQDATYTVQNISNSDYHTATTNIAGFARIDSLTQDRLYDVWSSKTGFSNSTVTQKVAVGS